MDPFPVPVPLDHHQTPPSAPAVAVAANPTPPALNHSHPPYAEMIYSAITALKEKDGSSRVAIAKYMEQIYSNLPANHSTLLNQHLKRLKNTGHLLMVKKSYKLPGSDAPVPNNKNSQDNDIAVSSSAHGPKKSRGRGRPPKNPNAIQAQPPFVPVGLADQPPQLQLTPAKRGRGRPKKIGGTAVGLGGIQKLPSGSGRRPGRPKKLKPVRATFGLNGVAQAQAHAHAHAQAQAQAQAQDQDQAQPISYALSEGNVPLPVPVQNVGRLRGRGRPKKFGSGTVASAYTARPVGRPVGRPKKSKSRTGRPVGRPRKTTTEGPEAQVGTTVGDLRRKLEYFQTKVKQVVDVLKPQLTGESQISAVAAIQELEGLATMDITAPLREDAQVQN